MTPCSFTLPHSGFKSRAAFPIQVFELQEPPGLHEGQNGAKPQEAGPHTEGEQIFGRLCSPPLEWNP